MAAEHAKVLKYFKNVEIVEVYSRTINNAHQFAMNFNILNYTNNIDDILKKKIDGIIICVSADKIYETTKYLLKYNIPLLIEKPVGLNLSELNDLIKINKIYNTPNLIGLNRRYYSFFKKINFKSKAYKGFIIEGHEKINKIKKIIKSNILDKWLFANSIHTINLINFFTLGQDYKLLMHTNNLKNDKNISCIVKTNKNIVGTYISNWESNGFWSVKLFFNGYHIVLKPLEKCIIINNDGSTLNLKLDKLDIKFKAGLHFQATNFLKLIKTKKNSWPDENLNSIKKTYKLLEKLN